MNRIVSLFVFLLFPLLSFGSTCNAPDKEDFLTFFFKFSGDKPFSTSRTVYPLKVLVQHYGIDEMGNDLSSAKRLTRSRKQDEELPSLSSTLEDSNLIAKAHKQSNNAYVVQIFGENSEWGQTMHFSLRGKCWYLYEFREHSISPQHWVEKQEVAPRSELVPHFYIKPDDQPLRTMLRVLNHLAAVRDGVSLGDMEDSQAELLSLCENLEANTEYAIEDHDQVARQLREALSLFNRGADIEGSTVLSNISRTLWARIN